MPPYNPDVNGKVFIVPKLSRTIGGTKYMRELGRIYVEQMHVLLQ
jgi:hypothetical protein